VYRILLVEDDAADAQFFRDALEEEQAERHGSPRFLYEWVDRVSEAERLLEERAFDVVLLDLILPDTNGKLDGLARIRARVPNVPIVVLTGLDDLQLAMEAVQQGAQDYLVKGDVTASALERALLNARTRQKIERAKQEETVELARGEAAVMTAGIIAHKVRSPVGAALGVIELIHDDPTLDEDVRADLDLINSELRRAAEILNQYDRGPRR
jgi:DNA-binding response OmpR family regulator